MSHTGHYLKPAKRVTTPGVIFSVVQSTSVLSEPRRCGYIEQSFSGGVVCYTKKTRGQWSECRLAEFTCPRRLHDYIRESASRRKRNYIICPSASNILVLTRWFHHAEEQGILFTDDKNKLREYRNNPDMASLINVNRIVLRGKPDILSYQHFRKSYVWLSIAQYFDSNEDVLSSQFGHLLSREHRAYSNSTDSRKRLAYSSILNLTVFRALSDWWAVNSKAPFGLTVGQLSMGILRSHVKPKTISTHTDDTVHKLERLACYGGRASCWYVGSIGRGVVDTNGVSHNRECDTIPNVSGPIIHIDVRSMYPTILRNHSFPCKLVKRTGPITPQQLRALQTYYYTIAHVRVRIHNAEYPMRRGINVIYPRGVFQTVLTGVDIEAFSEKDEILEVYECALYIAGEPFRDAANFLLESRIKARNAKDHAWEAFAKTLANSLGGKLAQRKGHWTDKRDMVAERQWGEWMVYNADTTHCRKYRAIAGMVSEYIKEETGSGPFTACFAYLTAYGRQLMRRVRSVFDSETVVSQDTDGLWVLGDIPYTKLAGVIAFGDSPGNLQIKEVSSNGRFFGPKHYYVNSGWILAGFHNPSTPNEWGDIIDTFNANPIWSGCSTIPTTVKVQTRSSRIQIAEATAGISPYGWNRPLYLEPTDTFGQPIC